MNVLLDLEDKLRTTGAAIGKLEIAFGQNPSRSLQSNILSLRKLQSNLQSEFDEVADQAGRDVCRYRLLIQRPSIRAFTGALAGFQDAFSQVFGAIHDKRKRDRRVISDDAEELSSLEMAYAFPGSFGFAFTIPNAKLLLDIPSELDRAALAVFDVMTSSASDDAIVRIRKDYGRAPVAAIYEWAANSAANQAGADIEWVRGDKTKASIIIQVPQFARVSQTLEVAGESREKDVVLYGFLVGADTKSHRFHFIESENGESIRGEFSSAISETQQATLPAQYKAYIRRTTVMRLATNTETTSYFLERLESPGS